MTHRHWALVIAIPLTFASGVAEAGYACAGWGSSWAKRLAVNVTPSEGELEALIACDRVACSVECAAYLAKYDACAASGPPCEVTGATEDCAFCQRGTGAWTGIGCEAETQACSFDLTGCVTCEEWIDNASDPDNLCYQQTPPTSIDYAISVSDCACDGGCAAKCAGACALGYFDPASASFGCGACVGGGACSAAYASCALH